MKNFKIIIPNIFTSLNLFAGFIAIIMAFIDGKAVLAAFFIVFAAIFDFIDGALARLLKAESKFGKNLDSFADVVSFGVAPGIIIYQLLVMSLTEYSETATFNTESPSILENVILFSPFLIVLFSAIRLSVFNISENQKKYFKGLPTPASALFIASIWLTIKETENEFLSKIILNPYIILFITVFLSILLISNIRMLNLKFSNFKIKGNLFRYLLIIISLILILKFKYLGLTLSIVTYILLSIIDNIACKPKD